MNTIAHRPLFMAAGGFNFLAGLPLLVAPKLIGAVFQLPLNETAVVFMQAVAGVVLAFAVAYWMIARDPVRYRPFIWLGMGLKIFLAALLIGHWLLGSIAWPLVALVMGDVLFAALFARYLRQVRV